MKIMPIGVPRIIYSWGEELPAQWTDIYNFIFRRRMVFLMQYLDDELCNQICGLLINIHMEDRSKELEKNETEAGSSTPRDKKGDSTSAFANKKNRSPEDLLNSDEDLGIHDIDTLEQLTLQKITKEWLNWNSQFFDYSDEPYLYYLAQTLSKDFGNGNNPARSPYDFNAPQFFNTLKRNSVNSQNKNLGGSTLSGKGLDVYSAFRTSSGLTNPENYSLNEMHPLFGGSSKKDQLLQMFKQGSRSPNSSLAQSSNERKNKGISKFLLDLAGQEFIKNSSSSSQNTNLSSKALGQRELRREYNLNSLSSGLKHPENKKAWVSSSNESYNEFRDYYRKQTERSLLEEESKKVFVIINSFGGSVGNGITVHDALQFIKAGSLTLGLGVAASASSLVLAGGTIGERYVTEGCHTMIHQPESSLQGQASDIWIDSQEIMKIRLDVAEIYSLSTYRPRHKILRDLDRDFYLTAPETIAYGLADEIATNEVMHEIVEMTAKVWDVYDGKQQRLLESRESASSGSETQTQS